MSPRGDGSSGSRYPVESIKAICDGDHPGKALAMKYSVCCEARAVVFVQWFMEVGNRKAELLAGRQCTECGQWLEINEIQRRTVRGWRRVKTSHHLTKFGHKLLRLRPSEHSKSV